MNIKQSIQKFKTKYPRLTDDLFSNIIIFAAIIGFIIHTSMNQPDLFAIETATWMFTVPWYVTIAVLSVCLAFFTWYVIRSYIADKQKIPVKKPTLKDQINDKKFIIGSSIFIGLTFFGIGFNGLVTSQNWFGFIMCQFTLIIMLISAMLTGLEKNILKQQLEAQHV